MGSGRFMLHPHLITNRNLGLRPDVARRLKSFARTPERRVFALEITVSWSSMNSHGSSPDERVFQRS